MHPLLEAAIRVGKMSKSAETLPQKQSAERYRRLFLAELDRQKKPDPIKEGVLLAVISAFAIIGVITVLQLVKAGLID